MEADRTDGDLAAAATGRRHTRTQNRTRPPYHGGAAGGADAATAASTAATKGTKAGTASESREREAVTAAGDSAAAASAPSVGPHAVGATRDPASGNVGLVDIGPSALASGGRTTVLSGLGLPLAFVNRYAETFDVLVPCLHNQEALRENAEVKMNTPLAAQPPGTGKTELGRNIINVLRRPRETTEAAEEAVAQRLSRAWCWDGNMAYAHLVIAAARRDPRDENLVMRTLLVSFPNQADMLLRLKASTPVFCRMRDLPPPNRGFDFGAALAYIITCAAEGLQPNTDARTNFLARPVEWHTPDGAMAALVEQRGPLLLVLDDITDFADDDYSAYHRNVKGDTPLHQAMKKLSLPLQRLQSVRGCFTYCTGSLLSLATKALVGNGSPLFVRPVLLQPLNAADVCESLQLTPTSAGRVLAVDVGVAPEKLAYFAERIVSATGGIGRVLQFALRTRQWDSQGGSILNSEPAIDTAVDALLQTMKMRHVAGVALSVSWDGPANNADTMPAAMQSEREKVRLVHLLMWALLLGTPFRADFEVVVGQKSVLLSDVAVILGMSYAPISSAEAGLQLRVVAGEWLVRSLLTDPEITKHPTTLATAFLLKAMLKFDGTMRGRPFELLCVNALCAHSLFPSGGVLKDLLPHLGQSSLGREVLPKLSVVVAPKVTAAQTARLGDAQKAEAVASRAKWPCGLTLHPGDLPWFLSEWLGVGTVAMPADAQSGSQDWFARLEHGILGVANKAVGPNNGTGWAALCDELNKAPRLGAGLKYTLVVWSLSLAPELQSALGNATSGVYGPGAWFLKDGRLVQNHRGAAEPVFVVPAGMELVVGNPHTSGGALQELLGVRVMHVLAANMPSAGSGLPQIAFLDALVTAENPA
jgi:hypothetical protein